MRKLDLIFMASAAFLLLAGLATLYSIGVTSNEPIFFRQLLFFLIGVIAFFIGWWYDYRLAASLAKYIYLIALVFLVVVLFLGDEIRGSHRWLELGAFNLQPSELAKVALILGLSTFFAKKKGEVKSVKVILHSAAFGLVPAILVILQPDLGSGFVLIGLWFALLIMAPVRKRHILILVLVFAALSVFSWHNLLHDYQKERVLTFLDPQADPQGSGYNVRQSIIAVGSGQFWGRGLGRGLQSHLRFLPERHTDFIFASFAEELGFFGSLLLVAAFGTLAWRIILTAKNSMDSLGMYLCAGVAVLIIGQFFVNVGMNLGLLPVTGITLPLLSYGGSSLISTMFLLGLVQSVYRRNQSGI